MDKIIIIGAGFAGIGAARFLTSNKIEAAVFEKRGNPEDNLYVQDKPYKLDYESYIVSTRDKEFARLFNDPEEIKTANECLDISHYIKGCNIKHPPIENLYELPKSLVIKIVNELSELKSQNKKLISNLREWLYATFGRTFTDSILEKFIRKTYTLPSDEIDFPEIVNEFEPSSFDDILTGALTNKLTKINGNAKMNYLLNGDLSSFIKKAKTKIQIKFNYKVKSIDTKGKVVFFENGKKEKYSYLISSIPLPDLIGCIKNIPDRIISAAVKLAFTSCVIVDIQTERELLSNSHCTYFYDSDILFSQLIFPQRFSGINTPEKFGNIQALIHFSTKYKPLYLHPDSFIEPVINNLKRCGILNENDKVAYKAARLLPYANIIHDFNRRPNLSVIHKYLDELNIFYCGRYGLWTNLMANESYKSGITVAKKTKEILNLVPKAK